MRLFRVREEGWLPTGRDIGGLVIDKIIGSGHFGVWSEHLTVLVLKLDRSHKMIFCVWNIDPETRVTIEPGVEPEAALRAEVVVVGEVLVLVDEEAGVSVVIRLEDGHQGLEDGGECVHGVRGAAHQVTLTPRG